MTGFDIAGEFGAVGAMADKLRDGTASRHRDPDSGDRREAGATRNLVVCGFDSGYRPGRDRACRPRRRPAGRGPRCARRCARRCSRPTRSSFPTPGHRRPGIHVAKVLQQLGIADEVAARLKIFPNGATAMRHLAASTATRPIGCTQSTEIISTSGVMLSGSLPPGCDLSTIYTAAVTTQAANARAGPGSDRSVDRHRAARAARACGVFLAFAAASCAERAALGAERCRAGAVTHAALGSRFCGAA